MIDIVAGPESFDHKVKAFDLQRHSVFEGIARELQQSAAAPEMAEFGRVLNHAQKILGKSDLQMSQLFKVSRPTINRWTRGVTAPHPLVRKAVFDALLVEVRQALKVLRVS